MKHLLEFSVFEDIVKDIKKILQDSDSPMKAKEIAKELNKKSRKKKVDKKEVNRLLYSSMSKEVTRNDDYEWELLSEKRDEIQDKADAINSFGKLAKRKDVESMAQEYIDDRENNQGAYLAAYRIVVKKYKLEKKFQDALEELDKEEIDPSGGYGLRSHR